MEKLKNKYINLVKIHEALAIAIERYREAVIEKNVDHETKEERRDSLIKRFELTYDLLWKYLREYITTVEGITVDSPRKVFQQCLVLGFINSTETEELINLIEDRNLTTHVYDVDLANKVANDIQKHYNVITEVIKKFSFDAVKNNLT